MTSIEPWRWLGVLAPMRWLLSSTGVLLACLGSLGQVEFWPSAGAAAAGATAVRAEASAAQSDAPAAAQAGAPGSTLGEAAAAAQDPRELMAAALLEDGVTLDLEHGLCSLEARVATTYEVLEYLLVGPRGQNHESLLSTDAVPSSLNAALLALGVEPGLNLRLDDGDAQPPTGAGSSEQQRAEAEAWRDRDVRVLPPEGQPVFLHAGWRAGNETYFYRIEDLVLDAGAGRVMPRQGFVFLGSKMLTPDPAEPPVFAADHYQNLINLALFPEGHTLLTSRLRSAIADDIWYANRWMLPADGQPVRLVIADRPLGELPEGLAATLPEIASVEAEDCDASRSDGDSGEGTTGE